MEPHQPVKDWAEYYDLRRMQEQCRRIEEATGIGLDEITTLELFLDNMAAFNLSAFVEPARGMSTEVIKGWDQPIRMLFIDGSHE